MAEKSLMDRCTTIASLTHLQRMQALLRLAEDHPEVFDKIMTVVDR